MNTALLLESRAKTRARARPGQARRAGLRDQKVVGKELLRLESRANGDTLLLWLETKTNFKTNLLLLPMAPPPRAPAADPLAYLSGSALSAVINFPLWKAAAIGQSGFKISAHERFTKTFGPPYKGVAATIFGMTWARAAIFYCSDKGKKTMLDQNFSTPAATSVPAIAISTIVQIINQPIVRGTVTVQDPNCAHANLINALAHIYKTRGMAGLWHGTSAGVLKTVPKYVTAIWVKDIVQHHMPPPTLQPNEPGHRAQVLRRSAVKSIAAGVAGAALTNPLDVLRNEMFKTDLGATETLRKLMREEGLSFMQRGMGRNLIAVAAPIGMTIFLTDWIVDLRKGGGGVDFGGSSPQPVGGKGGYSSRQEGGASVGIRVEKGGRIRELVTGSDHLTVSEREESSK